MAQTYADLLRQRLAQGSAQTVPQLPVMPAQTGYGGTTTGSVPLTTDQAVQRAAQERLKLRVAEYQKLAYAGRPVAGPPVPMPSPPIDYRPPSTAVPVVDDRIAQWEAFQADQRKTLEGVKELPSEHVGPSLRPEGLVPQWDEIRRFEENVNLPTTDTPPAYTEDQLALIDSYVKIKTEDAIKGYEVAGANLNSAQLALHDATINYQNDPTAGNELLYNRALNSLRVAEFNFERARELYEPTALEPALRVVAPALNLVDKPRQMVVTEMGANAYDVATGKKETWDPGWAGIAFANWDLPFLGRMSGDFETWVNDPRNWPAIRNASENGFQSALDHPRFTGGRAVWELFINTAGLAYKTMMDLFLDPLTSLPALGRGGKAIDVLGRQAIGRGQPAIGALERTVGGLLRAPQLVMDVTADLPFNIAGKAVGGIAGVIDERVLAPLRNLAADTNVQANIAARETTSEALSPYASRRKNYPGPDGQEPPSAGGPTPSPPGSGGWYTISKKGTQRIIIDPEGNTHSVHTVDKPSYYNENQVNKIKTDLNLELRRQRAADAGWSVPKENQGWMDPYAESYDTSPNAENDALWFGGEVAQLSRDPFNRPATDAFVETYYDSGIAKSYKDAMEEISKQGGRDDFLPEKAYLRVTHFADEMIPIWRETIQRELGFDPPAYLFKYGDALDPKIVAEITGIGERGTPSLANAIEHATFGTSDTPRKIEVNGKLVDSPISGTSSMARRYLFKSNLMVDVPEKGRVPTRTLATEFEQLRTNLYGEESLSLNRKAVSSRKARAKRAQEPVPNDAALTDLGIPPARAAPTGTGAAPPQSGVLSFSPGGNPIWKEAPYLGRTALGWDITPWKANIDSAEAIGERYWITHDTGGKWRVSAIGGSFSGGRSVGGSISPPSGFSTRDEAIALADQRIEWFNKRYGGGTTVTPPAPTPEQAAKVIATAKKRGPRKARTMKPAVSVLDLPDEKTIISTITEGGNRSGTVRAFTPSKRRITPAQAGDMNVWTGSTEGKGIPGAVIELAEVNGKKTWTVKSGDKKVTIGDTDSIRDAMTMADTWLNENMPPMGIVAPSFQRTRELEQRARASAFAGQTEGPGVADWALPRDASGNLIDTVPARMLADGVLTMDQYDVLVRTVDWNGKQAPLWQVFDDVIARLDGDAHAAIEMINAKIHPFNQIPFKELSKLKKAARVYVKTITALREMMQYNIANGVAKAIADQVGNAYTLLVTGKSDEALRMWTPGTAFAFISAERGDLARFRSLSEVQNLHKFGIEAPHSVTNLHIGRSETGTGDMVLRDVTNKWGGKLTGSAYGIFANKMIRDVRNALDRNARFTLFKGEFDREIRNARTRFYEVVRTRATRLGKNADEWERAARGLGDAFSDEDVLRALGDQRLARDWRAMVMESRRRGERSVNKRLFSYRQTKADEALRQVVFFHYWQSRALYLHTRTALENPYLLNAYLNAWSGMQQAAEDGNLPPSVRTFLQYMSGPGGWYALINPIGVLVPFDMILQEGSGDETVMEWFRRHGAFFNPLVEGAMAALGMTNRVPDLTSTRAVRRAFKAMVNFGNAHGMEWAIPDFIAAPNTFASDPFEAWTYNLFERANQAGSWAKISREKDFGNPEAYDLDVIRSVLIRVSEESFGVPMAEWTPNQIEEFESAFDDIQLHRDGNDLADDTLEQWSEAQGGGTLASVAFPGGIRMRYEPRDTDIALSRAGYAALDTGEPAPEQQVAMTNRAIETGADVGDIRLDRLNREYQELGPDDGRWAYKTINDIVYATGEELQNNQIVFRDGTIVLGWEVQRMTEDQRRELANRYIAGWVDPATIDEFTANRDTFVKEHPEFAEFDSYKDIVRDYKGGSRQWRLDRAQNNPNFKQEMGERRDYLLKSGVDKSMIEDELDDWAVSLAGYKAAQGMGSNIYDNPPISTGDQGTVEAIIRATGGGGGGGKKAPKTESEKLKDKLLKYEEEMSAAIAAMQAAGKTVTETDIYNGNPYLRATWELYGVPSMNEDVLNFKRWQLLQPAGADTSVDAYLRVLMQLERAA